METVAVVALEKEIGIEVLTLDPCTSVSPVVRWESSASLGIAELEVQQLCRETLLDQITFN